MYIHMWLRFRNVHTQTSMVNMCIGKWHRSNITYAVLHIMMRVNAICLLLPFSFSSKHLPISFSFSFISYFLGQCAHLRAFSPRPTDSFSFSFFRHPFLHTQYLFSFNDLFLSNHCHHILFAIYFRCSTVRHTNQSHSPWA